MTKSLKTALITGASSGIGATFAKTLAKEGWNLILTGRRTDKLTDLKETIQLHYAVSIQTITADLSINEDLDILLSAIDKNREIELLINNAGFGSIDNYFKSNFLNAQQMLNVHITASTKIVHRITPQMIENGRGAIINLASLSAFFPGPKSYYYSSTKAFMITFSECLYIDLFAKNIKVQALCPGFTNTAFHSRQGITRSKSYLLKKLLWRSPQQVVDKSLKSLSKRNVICIPGFFNRLIYTGIKIMPKSLYYKLAARNSDIFFKPIDQQPIPKANPLLNSQVDSNQSTVSSQESIVDSQEAAVENR